jgi:hypothetical protein
MPPKMTDFQSRSRQNAIDYAKRLNADGVQQRQAAQRAHYTYGMGRKVKAWRLTEDQFFELAFPGGTGC